MTQPFLHTIFKPENFSKEEHELILSQFKRQEIAKNEYFIREGQVANFYYFLEKGFARSYAVDIEGNDVTTLFITPGDIVIDWQSYFIKIPAQEYVQALSDCVAYRITFENFMKLFSIEAFREVGRTRLVSGYFEHKNHSLSLITKQAKDRYLHLLKTKPEIVQNVALKQIASYLGITDTSLSRIRKEIAAENDK
jgi:CRP-like cAMP-binding protein